MGFPKGAFPNRAERRWFGSQGIRSVGGPFRDLVKCAIHAAGLPIGPRSGPRGPAADWTESTTASAILNLLFPPSPPPTQFQQARHTDYTSPISGEQNRGVFFPTLSRREQFPHPWLPTAGQGHRSGKIPLLRHSSPIARPVRLSWNRTSVLAESRPIPWLWPARLAIADNPPPADDPMSEP
jgi:hypothetical protein